MYDPVIFETDLGHDPDDLFALLWMVANGIQIDAVLLSPGHQGQIDLAGSIRDYLNLNYKIGIHTYSTCEVQGKLQQSLINKAYTYDVIGQEYFKTFKESKDLLITGPAKSSKILGSIEQPIIKISNILMQGGFLPYSIYEPKNIPRLEKFENKYSVPSFNMNGDIPAISELVNISNSLFCSKRWVGKNVCHTITKALIKGEKFNYQNKAGKLLEDLIGKHGNSNKALHDMVAAILMKYPEIGIWYKGYPSFQGNGWSTLPNKYDMQNTRVLADLNLKEFKRKLLGY